MVYDPQIGDAFRRSARSEIELWAVWDAIACPTLLVRGEDSQTLSSHTAAGMSRRGPAAKVETIAGCGHAPSLMDDAQIGLIVDFLRSNS